MTSLLGGLDIVLVKTRFPENIGMAARACVNMGCSSLHLVDPERWDKEKARPLATPKGQDLLDDVKVHADLAEAVAPVTLVVGTTGWGAGVSLCFRPAGPPLMWRMLWRAAKGWLLFLARKTGA